MKQEGIYTATLLKALVTVAVAQAAGAATRDDLATALTTYKEGVGFVEDDTYRLAVSKSCIDSINGLPPDPDLMKAVLPGQTKVVNGVMYQYSATAPGSVHPYDWHVVQTAGKGKGMSAAAVAKAQGDVQGMFPRDVKDYTVGSKTSGGSTGAREATDKQGNKYIYKQGSNTNDGHVSTEFLANQLYSLMGVKTPQYELYDDGGGHPVLVSKFVPGCHAPSGSKDIQAMAQTLIADVMMANWDVYQNDNCLIDAAGTVWHVDNGGSLWYKARGDGKTYDGDILATYKSMEQYNSAVFNCLKPQQILDQIKELRKHESDVVAYATLIGNTRLANTLTERFKGLGQIESYVRSNMPVQRDPHKPKNVMPAAQMYRALSDAEVDPIWKAQGGSGPLQKLLSKNDTDGWQLLSKLCALRGFDAAPTVVSQADYLDLVKKNSDRQLFRGIHTDDKKKFTVDQMVDDFLYNDHCFYGTQGVYGEGLYFHGNDGSGKDTTPGGYQNSAAWKHAKNYSRSGGQIIKCVLSPDAKVIQHKDAVAGMKKLKGVVDKAKLDELQKKIDAIDLDIEQCNVDLTNVESNIRDRVYHEAGFDPATYAATQKAIDAVNWGDYDSATGESILPDFDTFVGGTLGDLVRAYGGTVTNYKGGGYDFTLPGVRGRFSLSNRLYHEPISVKIQNATTNPYHYPVVRFMEWVQRSVNDKVEARAQERIEEEKGTIVADLTAKIGDFKTQRAALENDKQQYMGKPRPGSLQEALCDQAGYDETPGLYAALMGYDAIYIPNGNGHSHGFYCVLNRSKVICSTETDKT